MQGAIFDVDDTLLNNYVLNATFGLHEQSRLDAAHLIGKKYGSKGLIAFTMKQSTQAFLDAKVHTLHAAVWQMLLMAGEVATEDPELNHPLLVEIVEQKEIMHERLLREHGLPISGALEFVNNMAERGLKDKLAIASTACRRDIDIFFETRGFGRYFPDSRIISRERFSQAKPNPEAYNLAFATLSLPESARPYVPAFEDDPRGIMSAKAAGLFTCAITTRFSREELAALEVAPDLIADSYEEFDKLFS
jgi:beta-phosphoglucomutase-like phosphatase (HAD superfamily)